METVKRTALFYEFLSSGDCSLHLKALSLYKYIWSMFLFFYLTHDPHLLPSMVSFFSPSSRRSTTPMPSYRTRTRSVSTTATATWDSSWQSKLERR